MTPANLAGMCALAGLQAVALTDHNTTGNCAAFCAAAAERGLIALPGMELATAEEIHVVCLFPDLASANAFDAFVSANLPPLENRPAIFGRQLRMDSGDRVLGEDPRFLAGASQIGIYDAAAAAARFGGLAYPAHIDRPSHSFLSVLGLWDPDAGFVLGERSRYCPEDFFAQHPDVAALPTVLGSDAHSLDQIFDAKCQLLVEEATPAGVLNALCHLSP